MNYCKEWLTFCYLWPVECHWWEDEASTRLVNWSGGFGWQCRSVNVVDSCVVIVLPTTVADIRHFSRPDVTALYIRRPCLPSHCGTSLECSACGRYIYIYIYIHICRPLCQVPNDCSWLNSFHGAFLKFQLHKIVWLLSELFVMTLVMWSHSFSFSLCHTNHIRSVIIIIITTTTTKTN